MISDVPGTSVTDTQEACLRTQVRTKLEGGDYNRYRMSIVLRSAKGVGSDDCSVGVRHWN